MAGCAYYNGLYNANRLVHQAKKAERDGRRNEARSLWERVAVKAESVAVRYPNSKHYDDALVLWGGALAASDQCHRGLVPLTTALETSPDTALRNIARLELGRCQVRIGQSSVAIATLTPLVPEPDTVPRLHAGDVLRPYITGAARDDLGQVARYWRAKAYALQGDFEQARVDFEESGVTEAAFELAVVYAYLGRSEDAFTKLQAQVADRYVEDRWLPTLDSLGALDEELATRLVDLLLAHDALRAEQRARLLAADAARWIALEQFPKGIERYDQLLRVVPETDEAVEARVSRTIARLRSTGSMDELPKLADSLAAALAGAPPQDRTVTIALDILRLALPNLVGRSTSMGSRQTSRLENENGGNRNTHVHPDLELFVAAELSRDSLLAPMLAATLFREVRIRFPRSAIAPKALIAQAQLDESVRDSLVPILGHQYAESPYTLALMGEDAPGFAMLEDSLRLLLDELRSIRLGSLEAESEKRNPD